MSKNEKLRELRKKILQLSYDQLERRGILQLGVVYGVLQPLGIEVQQGFELFRLGMEE